VKRHPAWLVACLGLTLASAAGSSGFGVFQHGGRGTAQAGALTARADDPSALHYNPAGIAFLDGLQILAGLDFSAPRDDFQSHVTPASATSGGASGSDRFSAKHQINPPPALYLTWKAAAGSRWAFGMGVDTPFWNNVEWLPVAFPLRGENWQTQMLLFEFHPVVAYRLGERWSVAGGARYFRGDFEAARETRLGEGGPTFDPLAANKQARGTGAGFAFDLAVLRRAERWGVGASLRGGAAIDGRATIQVGTEGHLPAPAVLTAERRAPRRLGVELPLELRAGGWYSVSPRVRLEVDAALARWSATENRLPWLPVCPSQSGCEAAGERPWDDTLSLRLGAEGRLTDHWVLSGGLAAEPSPVPSSRAEPGFPRGDAVVYALGVGYNFPALSFDLGYSLHDHDPVRQTRGNFSSHDQVFAVSARWRR
jgi:long-chain fatty acid transport protein